VKKKYFLGVDGGGTKTLSVIYDSDGNLLGTSRTGSLDTLNYSMQTVEENLFEGINESCDEAGIDISRIDYACLGFPVVGDVPGYEKKVEKIVNKSFDKKNIIVNDVRLALEGAFPLEAGIISLCGTGAMAMGKDEKDTIKRVDGWGEHTGDFGSGYYIGKKGLQMAFKFYDSRINEGRLLYEEIKKRDSVNDIREILPKCKGDRSRTYIASFSEAVVRSAEHGDGVAKKIISDSIDELVLSLETLRREFKKERMDLAFQGGLFKSKYFRECYREKIEENGNYNLREAQFPPHIGAIVLAYRKVLDETEIRENLVRIKNNEKN